jgi:Protein of unknown function (DUF1579)
MKIRSTTIVVLSLLALLLAPALPVLAQDQDKPKENAPAMGDAAMHEAMMKAMTPGPPHKLLARLAGDWTFTSKAWMAPSQPPMESSGTMHGETILDGRYVQTVWKGNMMGMAFEGHGTDGYDNVAQKYVSSWLDNMGTGIMYSTGTCDADGQKCEAKGSMMDPMTGKDSYMRSVTSWTGNDSFVMQMYGPDPSGKEFQWMEMTVKRK